MMDILDALDRRRPFVMTSLSLFFLSFFFILSWLLPPQEKPGG